MRRPKHLQDLDLVQDALVELRQATMRQLVAHTNRNYAAIQAATQTLRRQCRINWEYQEGRLVFFPTFALTEEVKDKPQEGYLICKYGMFYRPNCQGYTSVLAEAGRYSLKDAINYSHPNGPTGPRDGMTYIHESEAP